MPYALNVNATTPTSKPLARNGFGFAMATVLLYIQQPITITTDTSNTISRWYQTDGITLHMSGTQSNDLLLRMLDHSW